MSTAYYAVFHLLVEEACAVLARGRDLRVMRVAMARGFEHRTMRVVSTAFGVPTAEVAALCPRGVPEGLQIVAKRFVELQAARMDADYVHGERWRAAWATGHVERAESVLTIWAEVRSHPAARIYLHESAACGVDDPLRAAQHRCSRCAPILHLAPDREAVEPMNQMLPQTIVDRLLKRLRPKLPDWVVEVYGESKLDHDGDPVVVVVLVVRDDAGDDIMQRAVTQPVDHTIRSAFWRAFEGFVVIRYWLVSEKAEIDAARRREREREEGGPRRRTGAGRRVARARG